MSSHSSDVDFSLLYLQGIPDEYFDELRRLADDDGLSVVDEPRENVPFAAVEWIVPTVVAVYIGMKFIDAFVERAADDFADLTYPRFKKAVKTLARKSLIRDRSAYTVLSAGGANKLTSPGSLIFSICADGKSKAHLKFVFDKTLSETALDLCIDHLFFALHEHHFNTGGTDVISRAVADRAHARPNVYLVYDEASATWGVIDPIQQAAARQRDSQVAESETTGDASH